MAFLGACILLPYNCLLSAQPYFDDHAFQGMKFPFTSMLVYSLFLCSTQVVLTLCGESLTVRARVASGLGGGGLACAALLAVAALGRLQGRSVVLCVACLASVAALAVSNSLLQTALLGVAGAMGPALSGAVMVGLGVCGLLSLGVSLLVQAVEQLVGGISEANGDAGAVVAGVLFTMCIVYTCVSVWLYFGFLSTKEPQTVTALMALEDQRRARRALLPRTAAGRGTPMAEPAASSSCAGGDVEEGAGPGSGLLALQEVWPQALNVWIVFAVTLCVFPGVLLQWAPGPDSAFHSSRQLFGTLLIGTFQAADVMSRLAAGWAARVIPPPRLWIFVLLRAGFIPLFILGQRDPGAFGLWGADWGRFLLTFGLAFTNGLLASCAMMFGPERAAQRRREAAGIAMSCVMVLGIFAGTLLAFLTQVGTSGQDAA